MILRILRIHRLRLVPAHHRRKIRRPRHLRTTIQSPPLLARQLLHQPRRLLPSKRPVKIRPDLLRRPAHIPNPVLRQRRTRPRHHIAPPDLQILEHRPIRLPFRLIQLPIDVNPQRPSRVPRHRHMRPHVRHTRLLRHNHIIPSLRPHPEGTPEEVEVRLASRTQNAVVIPDPHSQPHPRLHRKRPVQRDRFLHKRIIVPVQQQHRPERTPHLLHQRLQRPVILP